jgi:type I restriction enzyme R subunit
VFFTHLLPWLSQENENQPIDLSGVKLTHYRLDALDERRLKLDNQEQSLKPITEVGGGMAREPETAPLSELIQKLNQLFEGELSDADLLGYAHHIKGKMLENEKLAQQATRNSKEQFALGDFQHVLMDNVIEGIDRYQAMAGQVMGNPNVQKAFGDIMLDLVYHCLANSDTYIVIKPSLSKVV